MSGGDPVRVLGRTVDDETRCVHYATPLDVIAIRFACCGEYYPCHLCHAECADHPAEQWPREQRDREAILCGVCSTELTIDRYLEVDGCPNCDARFNPGCHLHSAYYFQP